MTKNIADLANRIKSDPSIALKAAHVISQIAAVGDELKDESGEIVQPPWYRYDKKRKTRIAATDCAVTAINLINDQG